MKKKVLLFACIEKNIGDDLFVQTLCERYPHIKFVISSEANYGTLSKIENLSFSESLKWWIFLNSLEPRTFIRRVVKYLGDIFLKCIIGQYEVAVFIVGNAFKNFKYQGKYQSEWIRKRVGLARKFYLLSTNFGPYDNYQWVEDHVDIFKEMADVCFRDKESYDLFKQMPNVRYAPDAILSRGKSGNSKTKDKNIIISLIDCSFKSRDESIKKLSLPFENKIVEVIDYLTEAGYTITLLNSNTIQDAPASNRILKQCKSDKVDILNYSGDLGEVFALYEKSCAIIATRLHTIILAWLFDMPVFPIVYDIKVSSILKAYKFEGEYCNLHNIDSVVPKEIVESLNTYKYCVSNNVINEAQKQFLILDQELG